MKKKGSIMNSFLSDNKNKLETRAEILSDVEKKNLDLVKIQEISNTISRDTVNTYGTNVQSKLGAVSSQLLETVKGKDSGEVNKDLNALINVLKQNDPKKMFSVNDGFFSRLFGRVRDNIELRIREHESVQKQIDAIKHRLEDGITVIDEDNKLLHNQYLNSMEYIVEVDNLIKAGELKLIDSSEAIGNLQAQLDENNDDYMLLEDYHNEKDFYNRLDKKVFDLNASRLTVIQQLPKIRIVAEANNILKDRIRNAIDLAIPVWTDLITNQLVLLRQQKLLEQVSEVNNAVNKALEENSKLFGGNITKAVRENEKGIVDVSKIKEAHLNTVKALEEALKIQEESRLERQRSKEQLKELEKELSKALISNDDRKLITG